MPQENTAWPFNQISGSAKDLEAWFVTMGWLNTF